MVNKRVVGPFQLIKRLAHFFSLKGTWQTVIGISTIHFWKDQCFTFLPASIKAKS